MNTDDLYRLLRTGHAQAQGIVDTIADPLLVLDGAMTVQAASRSFFETFKADRYETIGRTLFDLGNGQWDIPELRRLLLEVIPKASAIIDFEVEHDFPELGRRKMLLTARTVYQPDGGGHTILLVINDVTDQQRRDIAKDLLFGELRHRIKNLLGVIQALARQTTTADRSAEEYRDDLMGRLGALIEAENFAFDTATGTDLKELVEHILAPYSHHSKAVTIEPGAPVDLTPRQVMSLSMIFHELATNGAKYGSLSSPSGRTQIAWQVANNDNDLIIRWAETNGPAVHAPETQGFGTKLIRSTTTYNLHGSVELNYDPAGFNAEFVIPLRDVASHE